MANAQPSVQRGHPVGLNTRAGAGCLTHSSPPEHPHAVPPARRTDTHTDQAIALASVPNMRDVGGLATTAGRRVRTGVLYRSGALDMLEGDDAAHFARLGIRTIYDFRTESERTARPDRVPPNTEYVAVDVLGDLPQHTPGQIMALLRDPAVARDAFGDGKGAAMFVSQYRGSSASTAHVGPSAGCSATSPMSGTGRPWPIARGQGSNRLGGGVAVALARRARGHGGAGLHGQQRVSAARISVLLR